MIRSAMALPVIPIHKGSNNGVTIQIGLSILKSDLPNTIFRKDAESLYRELRTHLPNGTYMELCRLFAEEK